MKPEIFLILWPDIQWMARNTPLDHVCIPISLTLRIQVRRVV